MSLLAVPDAAATGVLADVGPTVGVGVEDLDATGVLVSLEATELARRREDVEDLLLCLHWADLHASDPRDDPGGARLGRTAEGDHGRDRLVPLGGDGTPMVRDLSIPELGVARRVHPLAARSVLADALDLRHRLPRTFAVVRELGCPAWVARRAAAACRHLSAEVVGVVDAAVAGCIAGVSPSRVEAITAAAVIEADPWTHQGRVAAERQRRFVRLGRVDEAGLRALVARVTTGDAVAIDATLARVAEILRSHPDHPELHDADLGVRRSAAIGWLARPAELLELVLTHTHPADADPAEVDPDEPVDETPARAYALPEEVLEVLREDGPSALVALRPRAQLYVHLHAAALATRATANGEQCRFGVARVEGQCPIDVAELAELLAHTDLRVTPVVDLDGVVPVAVDAYEYPTAMRERISLVQPADAFPHASRVTRDLDLDHPAPWHPDEDGLTGEDNAQPLSRTVHRAKTHLGYTVTRIRTHLDHRRRPPVHLWRSPHGLWRLVDHTGTRVLTVDQALRLLETSDEIGRALGEPALGEPA